MVEGWRLHTGRRTDRQVGRQVGRHVGRQIDRHTHTHTHTHANTNKQTNAQNTHMDVSCKEFLDVRREVGCGCVWKEGDENNRQVWLFVGFRKESPEV